MKIGDRVRFTKKIFPLNKGMTGTIVTITKDQGIGVEFDDLHIGHDCNGHAMKKKGYYVSPVNLEIINDSPAWPEKDWKIVIMPDDDKTIAKFIRNGNCIKEAFVNRYFKDTYNTETAVKEVLNKLFKPTGYTGRAIYYNTSKAEGLTRGKIYTFENGVYKNDNGEYRVICRENIGRYDEYFEKLFVKIVE